MNTLKQSTQWVCWKREEVDGRPTKLPYNPKTGGKAMSNNPATWATYELAEREASKYDGVGFMFSNGVCGIDIDGADGDQRRQEAAREIIALMDSYTEYSPSGSGYHIIFKCDLARIPQQSNKLDPIYYQKNPQNGIECYFSGLTNRYFTYTGEVVNDRDIEDRTDQILTFLDKYMKRPPQNGNSAGSKTENDRQVNSSDSDIISRMIAKDNKLHRLFNKGDISGYGSHSEADQALVNKLAWYLQGNAGEIDAAFRRSALFRDKWNRADYRTDTIGKAISLCGGEYYTPPKRGRPKKKAEPEPIVVTEHAGAQYFNPFDTQEKKQRYGMNDIGAGNFFADVYKNVSRFVPEASMWYVYNGRVWQPDVGGAVVAQQAKDLTDYMLDCRQFISDEDLREAWVKFASSRMKRNARETMLKDAQSVYPVYIKEFDKDPYLFNCQNCTLNLRDFTLHSHRPDDFLSKISNVVFDKSAKCERWTQFISEIMRGDMPTSQFMQKALGYTLTGDTSEECFFILYGSTTRNGKGTTMETTLHLLGDYGRTAQPETIAQKQNFNSGNPSEDIARLKGARFVNMSEPDKGLRLNAALVKQVTGGDSITARFLHQNSFEYRPEYKLFINTNHLPRVSDDSIFASGRVHTIAFERHFEPNEQDKGLKAFFKQPENMSGIFNWFIEGLKLMRSEGLEQPQAVKDATNQYREDSDTVGLFIRECLIESTGLKTPLKDIHAEYSKWCEDNGYGTLNSRNLGAELRRKGLKTDRGTGNKLCLFGYGILVSDDDLPTGWRK